MAEDFYQVLGIKRGASTKEIKQAYRKLAREFHPDVNPDDKKAEERFKEINNAHEVLSLIVLATASSVFGRITVRTPSLN